MGPYYEHLQWTLYHFDRTRTMEQDPWLRDLPKEIAQDLAARDTTIRELSKPRSRGLWSWLIQMIAGLQAPAAKKPISASAVASGTSSAR